MMLDASKQQAMLAELASLKPAFLIPMTCAACGLCQTVLVEAPCRSLSAIAQVVLTFIGLLLQFVWHS